MLERGDEAAADEHARRAVAAARVGADGLSVGTLGSCRRQSSSPVTSAGLVPIAGEAVERPDAPDLVREAISFGRQRSRADFRVTQLTPAVRVVLPRQGGGRWFEPSIVR